MSTKAGMVTLKDIKQGKTFYLVYGGLARPRGLGGCEPKRIFVRSRPYKIKKGCILAGKMKFDSQEYWSNGWKFKDSHHCDDVGLGKHTYNLNRLFTTERHALNFIARIEKERALQIAERKREDDLWGSDNYMDYDDYDYDSSPETIVETLARSYASVIQAWNNCSNVRFFKVPNGGGLNFDATSEFGILKDDKLILCDKIRNNQVRVDGFYDINTGVITDCYRDCYVGDWSTDHLRGRQKEKVEMPDIMGVPVNYGLHVYWSEAKKED